MPDCIGIWQYDHYAMGVSYPATMAYIHILPIFPVVMRRIPRDTITIKKGTDRRTIRPMLLPTLGV